MSCKTNTILRFQDNLYLAAMKYQQQGNDYWTGPLSNDQVNAGPYYDKFWKVSKKEIEDHIAGTSMIIPSSIMNWPAHGRESYGESFRLAPYKNVSGEKTYSPEKGDYPHIRGDEAIFWINNNVCGLHGESGGTPLGVEIMSTAYAFNSEDYALNHTMFLSYEIRNKSDRNYKDLYVGFFADFDIGFGDDDYIGCDSLLNLGYGYNGKAIDGSGQIYAYGNQPPAQGAMFLNKKMSSFMYFNNGFHPIYGDPADNFQYYNYLQGIWRNGTPLTYGGTGYNEESTNYTKYAYSGDPATKTGWTELSVNGQGTYNDPGDRRGLLSAGPFNLKAGEKIKIDIALPFAQDLEGDYLTSVTMLKQNAQKIQEFYDNVILNIKQIEPKTGLLTVYPNPSNGQFIVSSNQNIKTVDFYDVMGRVQKGEVRREKGEGKIYIDFSNLPKGFYMYRAVLEDNSVCSGKIIVQ